MKWILWESMTIEQLENELVSHQDSLETIWNSPEEFDETAYDFLEGTVKELEAYIQKRKESENV